MPVPVRTHPVARVALAAVVVLAAVLGPGRMLTRPGFRFGDFAAHWSAARAWLTGQDPYDPGVIEDLWQRSGAAHLVPDVLGFPSVWAPTTLAALAPFAALPAWIAWWVWIGVIFALYGAAVVGALRAAGLPSAPVRAGVFVAAMAVFGPFVSCAGNAGAPAACLMVLAVCLALTQRDAAAGLLLGAACALKPQLALPLLLYFLYRRRWRLSAWTAAVLLGFTLVGFARLANNPAPWRDHWAENVRATRRPGAMNDVAAGNDSRDHLVNVESVVYGLTADREIANPGGLAVAGALAVFFAFLVRRPPADELLAAGAACALAAIPVYHRYYDTIPLLLAIAWAVGPRGRAAGTWRWVALAPLVFYFAPVGWQTNLVRRGLVPPSVEATIVWQSLVVPLNAWVLLIVCFALLGATARLNRTRTIPAP